MDLCSQFLIIFGIYRQPFPIWVCLKTASIAWTCFIIRGDDTAGDDDDDDDYSKQLLQGSTVFQIWAQNWGSDMIPWTELGISWFQPSIHGDKTLQTLATKKSWELWPMGIIGPQKIGSARQTWDHLLPGVFTRQRLQDYGSNHHLK